MASKEGFRRQLTSTEHLFSDMFFNNVVIVARVKGEVPPDSLEAAIQWLQQRHFLLRTVIEHSGEDSWFVEKADVRLHLQTLNLAGEAEWIKKCVEEQQIPFDYSQQPPIRFIHYHSPSESEIMIICQHAICDGKSLIYLIRDLLTFLGTPDHPPEPLPIPPAMAFDKKSFPVKLSWLERVITNRINLKWRKEKVVFDDTDLQEVQETFWRQNQYKIHPWVLPPEQTVPFVTKCKAEGVTVNTALINAVLAAHTEVEGSKQPYFPKIAMAVAMRERLRPPVGDHLGLYSSGIDFKYTFRPAKGFWANAKALHKVIQKNLSDQLLLRRLELNGMLDVTIFDALVYKKVGMFIRPNQPRYIKIHEFEKRHDLIMRFMKMSHMAGIGLNFVITNLGHLNIPAQYGPLTLEELYFVPPPSLNAEKTLGVATIHDNLCLNFSYFEPIYSYALMERVQQKMMENLATAVGW